MFFGVTISTFATLKISKSRNDEMATRIKFVFYISSQDAYLVIETYLGGVSIFWYVEITD